jgi:hypothetical protein
MSVTLLLAVPASRAAKFTPAQLKQLAKTTHEQLGAEPSLESTEKAISFGTDSIPSKEEN